MCNFIFGLLTFDFQFCKLQQQLFLPQCRKKNGRFCIGHNAFNVYHFSFAETLVFNSHSLLNGVWIVAFEIAAFCIPASSQRSLSQKIRG